MNSTILYIIESSLSFTVLFLLYFIILKNKSNFRFNRAYLILTVFASALIPLLDFTEVNSAINYQINLSPITIEATNTSILTDSGIDYWLWAIIFYIIISGIFTLRFFNQLGSIYSLGKNSKKAIAPKETREIFLIEQESFSFFNWIFINKNDKNKTPIFQHELAHSQKWHSLDIVFMKVIQIVFWFNPIVYLIEKELRLQHEYEVDALILNKGTAKNDYYQLLLNQLFGTEFTWIANNFNQTFLKNRFIMMTKKESKKLSKLVLLALLSLVIISPLAISCSMEAEQNEDLKEVVEPTSPDPVEAPDVVPPEEVSEEPTFTVVDKMPSFTGGEKAMYKFIGDNITYPKEAKKAGVAGRVYVKFVVEKDGSITDVEILKGIGSGCDEAALNVIKSMPNWVPGSQRGKAVRVQYNMPISFKLQ